MLINSLDLASQEHLQADICIVGAGPAGISIALQLMNTPIKVLLVESGDLEPTPEGESLNEGKVTDGTSHEPLGKFRRRTVGGTTAAWGGRCMPFDPIDFKERSFMPYSGWPVTYDELLPYFRISNDMCEAGPFEYLTEEAFPTRQRDMIPEFDNEWVASNRLERWSPPTHFGKRYEKELRESENVQVVYNLTCNYVQLDELGARVVQVEGVRPDGKSMQISADEFVLASSCIENTRLLLASNDVMNQGIGNEHDVVGRYYQAHLKGIVTAAKFTPAALKNYVHDFEKDEGGVYVRRRFTLTEQAQETYNVGNIIGFFLRPAISDPKHGDAVLSVTHLVKDKKKDLLSGKWDKDTRSHLGNVLKGMPSKLPDILKIMQQRNAERRLPYIVSPKSADKQYMYYQSEQAPNPESRVVLSHERDRTGLPMAEVGIRFSQIDIDTVLVFHRLMSERFREMGIGEFPYEPEKLEAHAYKHINDFNSGAHYLGTTRMDNDPRYGVVDQDCKVHGVKNLYISGASTFPTGSHANPTLTIVAFAVKLGQKLLADRGGVVADQFASGQNR